MKGFPLALLIAGALFWQSDAAITSGTVTKLVAKNHISIGAPTERLQSAGSTTGSLHELSSNLPPDARVVIFNTVRTTVNGTITEWNFYHIGSCKFCFVVFNPRRSKDGKTVYVEFGGENCIEVESTTKGIEAIEIPRDLRINVAAGSIMGLMLGENAHNCLRVETDKAKSSKPFSAVMILEESNKIFQSGDGKLKPGMVFNLTDSGRYENGVIPPFVAHVMAPNNLLELIHGKNKRSGYAGINKDGLGLICDRWYHDHGWPWLYCDEKDYPGIENVTYVTPPPELDGYTVKMKNPHCKETDNKPMLDCTERTDPDCDRNQLFYIHCKPKSELAYQIDNQRYSGVPRAYESNYFGLICDERQLNLDFTLIENQNHWANVVCREHGFPNAVSLGYADGPALAKALAEGGIALHNPICTPENGETLVNDLSSCRDAEKHCTYPASPLWLTCKH